MEAEKKSSLSPSIKKSGRDKPKHKVETNVGQGNKKSIAQHQSPKNTNTQDDVAVSENTSAKQQPIITDKSGIEQSFWQQAKEFAHTYKAQISITILVLYVITLAIATIIEIFDH